MRRVFISYAFEDSELAHRLAADLRNFVHDVSLADETLRPGAPIPETIATLLREADVAIFLLSKSSESSISFAAEVLLAATYRELFQRPQIIPVVTGSNISLPPDLSRFVAIDLSQPYMYKDAVIRLDRALRDPSPPIIDDPELGLQYIDAQRAALRMFEHEDEIRLRRRSVRLNILVLMGTATLVALLLGILTSQAAREVWSLIGSAMAGIIGTAIGFFYGTRFERSGLREPPESANRNDSSVRS